MGKQTILEEAKDLITSIKAMKAADLEKLYSKQKEAETKRESASLAMNAATESMDFKAYETAKTAFEKAQSEIEMYNGRFKQIKEQEYISEDKSDSYLKALEAYEMDLEEDFRNKYGTFIEQLIKLLKGYKEQVDDIEDTINDWQKIVHANYRSKITIYSETGTNRSTKPIPFHSMPYKGCKESMQLYDYLKKVDAI